MYVVSLVYNNSVIDLKEIKMTNSKKQEIAREITKTINSMDADKALTVDNIITASMFIPGIILAGFESMIVEYLEKYNSLCVGFTYMDEACENRTISGVYEEGNFLTQSDDQLGSHMARIESRCRIVDNIYFGLSSMDYNNDIEKERIEKERIENIEREKEMDINGFADDIKESNPMRYAKILNTLNKDNRKNKIKDLIKEGYRPEYKTYSKRQCGKVYENARVFVKGSVFKCGTIVNKTTFEYMEYLLSLEVETGSEVESIPEVKKEENTTLSYVAEEVLNCIKKVGFVVSDLIEGKSSSGMKAYGVNELNKQGLIKEVKNKNGYRTFVLVESGSDIKSTPDVKKQENLKGNKMTSLVNDGDSFFDVDEVVIEMEELEIANINTGVDQRRIQEDKPAFFLNWLENGKQKYFFSSLRSDLETVKKYLTNDMSLYSTFKKVYNIK